MSNSTDVPLQYETVTARTLEYAVAEAVAAENERCIELLHQKAARMKRDMLVVSALLQMVTEIRCTLPKPIERIEHE